jgi:hypothetical protein
MFKGLDLFSSTLPAIGLAGRRRGEIAQSKSAKLFGFAWIYLVLFGFPLDLLGFIWSYSSELGHFNGLRRIQIEKFPSPAAWPPPSRKTRVRSGEWERYST